MGIESSELIISDFLILAHSSCTRLCISSFFIRGFKLEFFSSTRRNFKLILQKIIEVKISCKVVHNDKIYILFLREFFLINKLEIFSGTFVHVSKILGTKNAGIKSEDVHK